MSPAWAGAGVAGMVAIGAALADRRRTRRIDLDRVGPLDWRGVQLLAIVALLLCVSIALNARGGG